MKIVSSAVEAMRDRINRQENYIATFTSPQGQEVLKHLIRSCHVTKPTFTPGDPYQTAFKEGQRHVILSILSQINKDTTDIIKQLEEDLNHG